MMTAAGEPAVVEWFVDGMLRRERTPISLKVHGRCTLGLRSY
jgi:hypothetical protein